MFRRYWVQNSQFKEQWLNKCPTSTTFNLAEAILALNYYPIMSWERFKRVDMTRGDVDSAHFQQNHRNIFFIIMTKKLAEANV